MQALPMPQTLQALTPLDPNIDRVEDLSDWLIKRARVHFTNGYQLSIVSGPFSYGGKQGLFEIAIFDPEHNYCPQLFEGYEKGDGNVLGYQTVEDAKHYISKIGSLPAPYIISGAGEAENQ